LIGYLSAIETVRLYGSRFLSTKRSYCQVMYCLIMKWEDFIGLLEWWMN